MCLAAEVLREQLGVAEEVQSKPLDVAQLDYLWLLAVARHFCPGTKIWLTQLVTMKKEQGYCRTDQNRSEATVACRALALCQWPELQMPCSTWCCIG